MRILSKFHDYYDSALKLGEDKDTIYLRERREVPVNRKQSESLPVVEFRNADIGYVKSILFNKNISFFYLGFCGKIYPAIRIFGNLNDSAKTLYSFDDYKKFCEDNQLNVKFDTSKKNIRRYWSWGFSFGDSVRVKSFFESSQLQSLDRVFFEQNAPVFIYEEVINREKQIVVNPSLKDLNFFTVKDSYTTYQELFMFIGGVLRKPEREMVKISDKDNLEKHGFDKWSFRKKT